MGETAILHACFRCREPRFLLIRVDGRDYCARCWYALGEPSPAPAPPKEWYEQEQATRERMLAHGGTSRHLVRKGIS
jgi:uncharacterized Zn finger protein (UPF0148 family)